MREADEASPPAAGRPAVLDLELVPLARFRPVELVSPGFTDLQLSGADAAPGHGLRLADTGPPAPYAAVEIDLADGPGEVVAGLASDDVHVLGVVDRSRRSVAVEVRAGDSTVTVARARRRLASAGTVAVTVCENRVTVLVRERGRWRTVLSERTGVRKMLDLRDPTTCAAMRYAWGVRDGATDADDAVAGVRAGLFGMAGLRDLHLVTHAAGEPYVENGRMFLTATCAGTGDFRQAHWGVFALDPDDPTHLEQTAHLFSRRDGVLLGDHAGQLAREDERWLVMTSSWGDFDVEARSGVHVRHALSSSDLLHGVHVLETERTPMPTWHSTWDPSFARIGDRWHVAYVESRSQRPFNFHPTLAVAPADAEPWEALRRVGGQGDLTGCEGPVLARVDGDWWVLASDGAARSYPVFDLAMRQVGRLHAPYPSNLPHPQLVPRADGSWLVVTFDGTPVDRTRSGGRVLGYGTHGDVHVFTTPNRP